MQRSLVLVLALAAAFALPAVAAAKGELVAVDICGPDGCKQYTNDGTLGSLSSFFGDGGTVSGPPPSPFYRVKLTIKEPGGEEFTPTHYYVPGRGLLAVDEVGWVAAPAAYEAAARGVKPFPTPKLERVLVNGREAEDPASYLALFTAGTTENAVPSGIPEWIPVEMRFDRDSPWTGEPTVFFAPEYGVLQRGGMIYRISDSMADSIRAGEGIGAAGGGFPWLVSSLVALALLASVVLAAVTLRRVPLPRPKRAPSTA